VIKRLLSLSLMLNVVFVGLALRLWAATGVAEAQSQTVITCVGFDDETHRKAVLRIHNSGTAETTAEVRWLDHEGGAIASFTEKIAPRGTSTGIRTDSNIGVVATISSPSNSLFVAAHMVYDDDVDEKHRRSVMCTR
jgi:hypothetical protein